MSSIKDPEISQLFIEFIYEDLKNTRKQLLTYETGFLKVI